MQAVKVAGLELEAAGVQVEAGSDEEHQGLDRPGEEGGGGG